MQIFDCMYVLTKESVNSPDVSVYLDRKRDI